MNTWVSWMDRTGHPSSISWLFGHTFSQSLQSVVIRWSITFLVTRWLIVTCGLSYSWIDLVSELEELCCQGWRYSTRHCFWSQPCLWFAARVSKSIIYCPQPMQFGRGSYLAHARSDEVGCVFSIIICLSLIKSLPRELRIDENSYL